MNKDAKIIYLFTTFPVLTETFLQREVRMLRDKGLHFEIYSLWGGAKYFEGMPVHRFSKWKLITLFWQFPMLVMRRYRVFIKTIQSLYKRKMPSITNGGETLIGLLFAIVYAQHFFKHKPRQFHAVWATMPATAAQLLSQLTDVPFSMGAHAYDVFENNGDWLLCQKLRDASFIQTSTQFTLQHLRSLGTDDRKILVIRRGLDIFPTIKQMRSPRKPLRLLSVGRLVEKKGYFRQLEIYRALEVAGIQFIARIVGDGPLRNGLVKDLKTLNLGKCVTFLGAMSYDGVSEQFNWADVFIYTGQMAVNGDRDGLPNVIPEAMAVGLPVVTSRFPGVCEVICDGQNGVLVDQNRIPNWIDTLKKLKANDKFYRKIRNGARLWVEKNFNAQNNLEPLYQRFQREMDIPQC